MIYSFREFEQMSDEKKKWFKENGIFFVHFYRQLPLSRGRLFLFSKQSAVLAKQS
jgi:capsid portal protein